MTRDNLPSLPLSQRLANALRKAKTLDDLDKAYEPFMADISLREGQNLKYMLDIYRHHRERFGG